MRQKFLRGKRVEQNLKPCSGPTPVRLKNPIHFITQTSGSPLKWLRRKCQLSIKVKVYVYHIPPRAPSPKDRTDLRAQKCQKSLRKAEWNDGSCWSNHRLSKLHPPAILAMRKNKCYIWSRKYCAERVTFRPIGKTANPSLALHSCSAPPPPLIPSPPRMKFVPLRDARRPSLKP